MTRFFKCLNNNNKHNDMQYVENSWNIDILPYNPISYDREGGLYFSEMKYIFSHMIHGTSVVEVLDYKDDKNNKEYYNEKLLLQMKANKIFIGTKIEYSADLFKQLVEWGADPYHSYIPVCYFMDNGDYNIVKEFIKSDIIDLDRWGCRLLVDCVHSKNIEMMEFIITATKNKNLVIEPEDLIKRCEKILGYNIY